MEDQVKDAIIANVTAEPGITLAEIVDRVEGATNGRVYRMIVRGEVYVDLCVAFLGDTEQVRVYRDETTAAFFVRLAEAQIKAHGRVPRASDLVPDTFLYFNGDRLKVIYAGRTKVSLRREDGRCEHFPSAVFERFMREGRVTDFTARPEAMRGSDVYEIAKRIETQEEKVEVLRRYDLVMRRRAGECITEKHGVTDRSVRNWDRSYRAAEAQHGNGLLGLVPRHSSKGNRTERWGARLKTFVLEALRTDFTTKAKRTKTLLYGAFQTVCASHGILKAPTYKTFIHVLKGLRTAENVEETDGSKVAYQMSEFFERGEDEPPIHGDRPWQFCHIDHTELDEELLHSETFKSMGKAWVTLLMDAYSRRVLAYYLTFDPPSYRSLLGVMRECFRIHGRFPECVVVDQGSDLQSVYFEKLLARFHCNKRNRPPSKPRFGAIIERLIHTLNKQFIHNLRGNTKLMKNPRQMTKAVNPKNLTVWNLLMLDEHLGRYFYEEYDQREHSALGMSPREAYDAAMAKFDLPQDPEPYDEAFIMDTLPGPRKETAKIVPQRGIKVTGFFYKSNKFRNPVLHGTRVEVRYDPYNLSVVYALIEGRWEVCLGPARLFSLLKNRSESEARLIFEEERQKYRQYGRKFNERAKEMALRHAERERSEKVEEQRMRDEELRKIAATKGGLHGTISRLDRSGLEEQSPQVEAEQETPTARRRSNKPKVFGAARRTS